MPIIAVSLATVIWTMPTGASATKQSADQLPAPQVILRWKVPSGLPETPNAKPEVAPVCQQVEVRKAKGSESGLFWGNKDAPVAGIRKLNEEPNADAFSAVLYSEGQCSKPIVVSHNVGMNPKAKSATTAR